MAGSIIQEAPISSVRPARLGVRMRTLLLKTVGMLVLAFGAMFIVWPLVFLVSTSLKDRNQLRDPYGTMLPMAAITATVKGEEYPLFRVTVDGQARQMALLKKRPQSKGLFVDPADPGVSYELKIADQQPLRRIDIHLENYPKALKAIKFGQLLRNTLMVTFVSLLGVLFSNTLIAYGFARFRAPGLNILFLLLLSTVMLPPQVRLIPTYVLFQKIGWVDTLLPLIVPAFFGNAYSIFLLRQFFMTIPLDLDDAAKIDGASPLQTLLFIILPQARPVLVSIAVFHFLYTWNDFYEPLIYLHSPSNWTLAVGLQTFNALFAVNTQYVMAISTLMLVPPVLAFFLSQRIFTQGVVFSGVKG